MTLEKNNKPVVRYSRQVVDFFNNLIDTLFLLEYFGFKETAKQYVSDMKDYIEENIAHLPQYSAPAYFSKYQKGMRYIACRSNKNTTWYFFFLQEENRYLICYITNNHFEGQYFDF